MKQWFVLDKSEWLVIIGSYPVVIIVNYLMLGDVYFTDRSVFFVITCLTTLLYVTSAWLMDIWKKYVQYRYPALTQSARRITLYLLAYVTITLLLITLIFQVYDWANVPGYRFKPANFGWVSLIGITLNVLSVGIFEALYFHGQWQQSMEREYELKQLNMQRQLDVLKQQVNPHFLFNSLNSLISLIGENPQKAEVFAEELSSVYRYVLRANHGDGPRTDQDASLPHQRHTERAYPSGLSQHLTNLNTELDFIRSYHHLLKTRHGSGLELTVHVDERFGTYQIPPLTLQLLVENAVKHNIALPEQPLHIAIESDEQAQLRVCNTLQKKKTRVLSNGVGLTNIITKYQILGQPAPTIQEISGQFVVTLPLIHS